MITALTSDLDSVNRDIRGVIVSVTMATLNDTQAQFKHTVAPKSSWMLKPHLNAWISLQNKFVNQVALKNKSFLMNHSIILKLKSTQFKKILHWMNSLNPSEWLLTQHLTHSMNWKSFLSASLERMQVYWTWFNVKKSKTVKVSGGLASQLRIWWWARYQSCNKIGI